MERHQEIFSEKFPLGAARRLALQHQFRASPKAMQCPHCLVAAHLQFQSFDLDDLDIDGKSWSAHRAECPACFKPIIRLSRTKPFAKTAEESLLAYPRVVSRTSLSPDVPEHFARDYTEASQTAQFSPRASAALSRRCLQHLLREVAQVKHGNLGNEIQEVLDSGKLPSHLADSLDAIRNIGNFAAHPIKSESTGEVVDVEPEEAEWTLDVLEGLFDYYFVLPTKLKAKREKLNQKLAAAGKPEMKQPNRG